MRFDESPEPLRDSAVVCRDDGGVGDRQAQRPSEQDNDGVPIGEAADHGCLRESSKKAEARIVAFQSFEAMRIARLATRTPPASNFIRLSSGDSTRSRW